MIWQMGCLMDCPAVSLLLNMSTCQSVSLFKLSYLLFLLFIIVHFIFVCLEQCTWRKDPGPPDLCCSIPARIASNQRTVTGAITSNQRAVTGRITSNQRTVTVRIKSNQRAVTGHIISNQKAVTGRIKSNQRAVAARITSSHRSVI